MRHFLTVLAFVLAMTLLPEAVNAQCCGNCGDFGTGDEPQAGCLETPVTCMAGRIDGALGPEGCMCFGVMGCFCCTDGPSSCEACTPPQCINAANNACNG